MNATAVGAALAFAGAAVLGLRLWWCGRRWKVILHRFEHPLNTGLDAAARGDRDQAHTRLAEALEATREARFFERRDRAILAAGVVLLLGAFLLGVTA